MLGGSSSMEGALYESTICHHLVVYVLVWHTITQLMTVIFYLFKEMSFLTKAMCLIINYFVFYITLILVHC